MKITIELKKPEIKAIVKQLHEAEGNSDMRQIILDNLQSKIMGEALAKSNLLQMQILKAYEEKVYL